MQSTCSRALFHLSAETRRNGATLLHIRLTMFDTQARVHRFPRRVSETADKIHWFDRVAEGGVEVKRGGGAEEVA